LYSKIPKLRERLAKHRGKIAEMEAQATEMEQEINAAEDEQLGYLARAVANTLSGGMEEVFAILQGLKTKPTSGAIAKTHADPTHFESDEDKEGETVE